MIIFDSKYKSRLKFDKIQAFYCTRLGSSLNFAIKRKPRYRPYNSVTTLNLLYRLDSTPYTPEASPHLSLCLNQNLFVADLHVLCQQWDLLCIQPVVSSFSGMQAHLAAHTALLSSDETFQITLQDKYNSLQAHLFSEYLVLCLIVLQSNIRLQVSEPG